VTQGVSARAARYDAWFSTPLGRAMDAAEARAVIELAAPQPGERALDAGCGTGIYTRRLIAAGATVIGVDSDAEMLAAARLKAPSATLVQGDVAALPFPNATFRFQPRGDAAVRRRGSAARGR
jgi:ubiquinone/menaquinone biosynthesis C-methylase UbiE